MNIDDYARPLDDSQSMPKKLLGVGSTYTGEMYHLRPALALSDKSVLIHDVTERSLASAISIASYLDSRERVYYSPESINGARASLASPPSVERPGEATSIIRNTFLNSQRKESILDQIADAVAPKLDPPPDIELPDLPDRPYLIVNYRRSGQLKGCHSELDTGTAGLHQILESVNSTFGGKVTALPMGDIDTDIGNYDSAFVKYWDRSWCQGGGRLKEATYLRYALERLHVVGAIGMRSGAMDMLSFLRVPIISIDVHPLVRRNKAIVHDETFRSWTRGIKLEAVYGASYGRVFLLDERSGEDAQTAWTGTISGHDIGEISNALSHFFGHRLTRSTSKEPYRRHRSHPLSAEFWASDWIASAGVDATREFARTLKSLIDRTPMMLEESARKLITEHAT